ncbi:glycosyl transferase [Arthrobacter sp. MN05-02]|nr:glycosyl transferase [Arthrobacter sp. MN05-02]
MYLPSSRSTPLRIALVGTRGVPARYGGFETCVEEVGQRLAARGHDVVVYCRSSDGTRPAENEYKGMTLVHLPALKRRSLETLSHTGLSAGHLFVRRADVAVVFNAANSPWLPVLRAAGIPVATHVDGLEWKRAKWGPLGKRYYRVAESLAVRWSDALIADAAGIQDYYRQEFGVDSTYLAYGAPILEGGASHRLAELGLTPGGYHLVVARFEPENHVHVIVEGYVRSKAELPLIVVGSAPYSDGYTQHVTSLGDERVRFIGGVWDQELLDQLYANARIYWHGHSVGGTNPSLLRAMGAGVATNAFDVNFNREVLGANGEYFADAAAIPAQVHAAEASASDTVLRGKKSQVDALAYDWDRVAEGYERLCLELAGRRGARGRRSGAFPLTDTTP